MNEPTRVVDVFRWIVTRPGEALMLLPAVSHGLELVVHWIRGTPELALSIAASVLLTCVSTAFNLFAMRRGIFVVGDGQRSIVDDLRRTPAWSFCL